MKPVTCIYKVLGSMRDVKPQAYRPRMVLIGLRDRSPKPNDAETNNDPGPSNKKIKKKYRDMEEHKEMYLDSFTERVGADTVEIMKETIKAEEGNIRGSYRESTLWVSPDSFVDHILKDSVFIIEFIIRLRRLGADVHDKIVDNIVDTSTVKQDLMLLENQLPYFIFKDLFGLVKERLVINETADQFVLNFFSLNIRTSTNFMHFTDMYRCVYEESLVDDQTPNLNDLSWPAIEKMENADYLSRVGVEFKTFNQWNSSNRGRSQGGESSTNQQPLETIAIGTDADDYSLRVAFERGCLVMSTFRAAEDTDTILRNVIAYEQCHVSLTPYTSNYIHFINFLITIDRDVLVLSDAGVLRHGMGSPNLVVDMVNRLNSGLKVPGNSQYHHIAMHLRAHCKSGRKRCWATLRKVYFSDLFTGTATIGGILILFLTLVGTVASVIQACKSFKDVPAGNTPQPSLNLN